MARAGMAQVLLDLRRETNAGTADHTIAGQTYWTDDQLQSVLDRVRRDYFEVPLESVGELGSGGTITYTKYYLPEQARWVERAGSESQWRIYDTSGSTVGTANYTPNYDVGMITFPSDTQNTTYYLDFTAFDLWWAAGDVWEMKASYVSQSAVDWSSDNHRVSRKQLVDNYNNRSRECRLKSPRAVRNVKRVRVDEMKGTGWR